MEISIINIAMAIGAGLASVLSPCVLPVIPIVMAGAEGKNRLRPLVVVLGLSISFMIMGAASALFGSLLVGKTRYIELTGAIIIVVMGLMVMFDLSVFKRFYKLSNIRVKSEGRFSGLILGMALGLIWVPCVGPFLSSTLTMVATNGQLAQGTVLLGFYSLGLAIPMLIVAYSSHLLQRRLGNLAQHAKALRYATGSVLVIFGLYSVFAGNFAY